MSRLNCYTYGRWIKHATLTTCTLVLLALPGCDLVGGLYGVFIEPLRPKKTIKAEHSFTDKTVLIWIDQSTASSTHPHLARHLTVQLAKALWDNEAGGEIVNYSRVAKFRPQRPDHNSMSIVELGQAFGADEVLYLEIRAFAFVHDAGPGYYQPHVSGIAKVVDVAGGQRIWPADQVATPFSASLKLSEGDGRSVEDRLLGQLGQKLAEQLAPRFYDHKEK